MSRYPYTYAADYLRRHGPSEMAGPSQFFLTPTLSRSDASHLYGLVADALGLDKEVVAKALADRFMAEEGIAKDATP